MTLFYGGSVGNDNDDDDDDDMLMELIRDNAN